MSSDLQSAVYLIHGIRDFGGWTTEFKRVFSDNGIKAQSKYLGWISLKQFILPDQVYMANEPAITAALRRLHGHKTTIIAHSFGGWFIANLLARNNDIKVKRLILCNTVVQHSFDWDKLTNVEEIICICGNRDIWPCLAEVASSRFSGTGTWGCQHPRVEDIYFDYGHGECLTEGFCKEQFLPLVKSNTPLNGSARKESNGVKFVRYINVNRFILLIAFLVILHVPNFMPIWITCSLSSCYVDIVRTDDFRDSLQNNGPHSYVNDVIQSYTFNYDEPMIHLNMRKTHNCAIKNGTEEYNKDELIKPQVFNILSDPTTPLTPINKRDCYFRYEIPLRSRHALFRIRTSALDRRPGGAGLEIPYIVRNLTIVIIPAPGTKVNAAAQTLDQSRSRAYSRLQDKQTIVDDPLVDQCRPTDQGSTYTISCSGIWLMPKGYRYFPFLHPTTIKYPGDTFLLCFTLSDWQAKDLKSSTDKCILRAHI